MTKRWTGRLLAIGLTAGGLAVPGPAVQSPLQHLDVFCRFSIDVSGQPDAHKRLLNELGNGFVACPFETGPNAVATVLGGFAGVTTCPTQSLTGLSVVRTEAFTGSAMTPANAGVTCLPFLRDALRPGEVSNGPVYVLERTYPASRWREARELHDAITPAVWRSGLPFAFYEVFSRNGPDRRQHEFVCFEMLSPGDADPETLLKETGVSLPDGSIQIRSDQPNCFAALKAMGYDMPTRGNIERVD